MIKCKSRGIIIDCNNKVYPCCFILTSERDTEYPAKEKSEYISNLEENWNSLNKYPLATILKHKAFTEHFNEKHWNDKNKCDIQCYIECRSQEKE